MEADGEYDDDIAAVDALDDTLDVSDYADADVEDDPELSLPKPSKLR